MEFTGTAEAPDLSEPLPDIPVEIQADEEPPSEMCRGCERTLADYGSAVRILTENQERMTDRMDSVVKGYNVIGNQVQAITTGLGGMLNFFASIANDLQTMTLKDKINILRELISNGN